MAKGKVLMVAPKPKGEAEFNFAEVRLLAARLMPYMRKQTISVVPTRKAGVTRIAVDSSMRCYFDPDLINEKSMEAAASEILFDVTRGVLNHSGRALKYLGPNPTKRQSENFQKASNMVVTQIFEEAGLPLPEDAVRVDEYGFEKNLLLEEYAMLLDDQTTEEEEPGDGDGEGQGEGQQPGDTPRRNGQGGGSSGNDQQQDWEDEKDSKDNPGLDQHEQEMLRRGTAKDMEEHEAQKGRGSMPGYFRRFAREVLKPKVDPVRELLAQVKYAVNSINGHGDYTWKKLNRRTPPGGIRLPAHVQPVPRILVVVDTSGSMGDKDLGLALGVISQVLKALPGEGVTVVAGDTHVASVGRYFRPDQVTLAGGGGTDMATVLRQAASMDKRPDAIILATDGETGWPSEPVGPKVVAAITRRNNHYPVPSWINVVELDPGGDE